MLFFLDTIPYITILIFGITIGSFLNVCIYRLPLGESIVTAPSHCMDATEKVVNLVSQGVKYVQKCSLIIKYC